MANPVSSTGTGTAADYGALGASSKADSFAAQKFTSEMTLLGIVHGAMTTAEKVRGEVHTKSQQVTSEIFSKVGR
jgi:hypothetical protein